jgi:sodium-dependent dicarboxylate transporter 2/3/5
MGNGVKTYSVRQLVGLILGLFILVLMLVLPPPTGMKPITQRMAAVALLMATWWITEAIPIPVTALLPLVLYPALGIMGTVEVAPNYTDELVFLFLGGFLIASAMVKWNLHRRIALHTILLIGTGPRRLILGFMIATAFLSMWISNTATALMMLPIAMAVVTKLGEGAQYRGLGGEDSEEGVRQSLGTALMLGIAYAASIGGIGTIIGTPPNGVFVGMLKRLYPAGCQEVTFTNWMMVGLPVTVAMIPLAWLLILWVAPSRRLRDFSFGGGGGDIIRNELKSLGPLRGGELKVGIVFLATAFLWIFRKPIDLGFATIPGWIGLLGNGTMWSDATVAVMMGIVLFLIPADLNKFTFTEDRRRNFLLDWRTAQQNVPWGILLLFGGGFALAGGFTTSELSKWIGDRLHFLGGFPILLVVATVCFLMTFLTEMTSNTATTTLMMPILAQVALGLGQHPFLLMIPAAMSASCAFMLPVATPPNAIVFGSGWVTVPRMSRTGVLLNLIGVVVITTVVMLIVTAVFGIRIDAIPDWARQIDTTVVASAKGR